MGAMARFGATRLTAGFGVSGGWPVATFGVNIVGGFLMGMLAGYWSVKGGAEGVRLFLGAGFLGGFTTFSAFSLDMMQMIERGNVADALLYALLSVTLALAALAAGATLIR